MRLGMSFGFKSYLLGFGLVIALGKLCLEYALNGFLGQSLPHLLSLFLLYYGVGILAGIPLWFYRQAQKRQGWAMERVLPCCVGIAVLYGLLHDQIALRVSTEYFTIGHFPIAGLTSPTLLAVLWGFLGTWWLGAGLGLCIVLAAYGGEKPVFHLGGKALKNAVWYLFGLEVLSWLLACLGYWLAQRGFFPLQGEYANLVPVSCQSLFMEDWWANGVAYLGVLAGVFGFCRHMVKTRSQVQQSIAPLKG